MYQHVCLNIYSIINTVTNQ